MTPHLRDRWNADVDRLAGATAAKLNPALGLALINQAGGWGMQGRTEMYLRTLRDGVARLRREGADLDPEARRWLINGNQGGVDELLGDRQSSASRAIASETWQANPRQAEPRTLTGTCATLSVIAWRNRRAVSGSSTECLMEDARRDRNADRVVAEREP